MGKHALDRTRVGLLLQRRREHLHAWGNTRSIGRGWGCCCSVVVSTCMLGEMAVRTMPCSVTRDFSSKYEVTREAVMKPPTSNCTSTHLPNRDELPLRT